MENIRYNSEGYYDEIAYKAIRNVMKGERNMQELRKGDIYEYERNDGRTDTALILSVHEEVCNILSLKEVPFENSIEIKARNIMFTDAERIQYVFNNKLVSYVRTLKDEEFEAVMERVKKTLGIEECTIYKDDEIEEYKKIINTIKHEKCELASQNENLNETIEDLANELESLKSKKSFVLTQPVEVDVTKSVDFIKCMAERDLYKELFEKAFAKIVSK